VAQVGGSTKLCERRTYVYRPGGPFEITPTVPRSPELVFIVHAYICVESMNEAFELDKCFGDFLNDPENGIYAVHS
jgi:hypothetical protein